MLVRRKFQSLADAQKWLGTLRAGRILMRHGRLECIEQHWISSPVSIAQVWWESHYGRLDGDVCRLDFHIPRGLPSFITLDYIRSGHGSSYRTFVGACHVLDEIARIRRADAIVAHVTNGQLSDRLLTRLGWQRHMPQWRGRHFIRRFYGQYPPSVVHRYTERARNA